MHSVIKHRTSLSIAFFITITSPLCLAQTNNSTYLQLLEGEASNLTLDEKTKAKSKKATRVAPSNSISSNGGIPQSLSFDDFMNYLKVNFIGTYFFAKRLSASKQNNIYTFYQKNNNPQDIRTQVIKINKSK